MKKSEFDNPPKKTKLEQYAENKTEFELERLIYAFLEEKTVHVVYNNKPVYIQYEGSGNQLAQELAEKLMPFIKRVKTYA